MSLFKKSNTTPLIISFMVLILGSISISVLVAKADSPDITIDANTNLGPMDHFWAGFGFGDLHAHMDPNTDEYLGNHSLFDLIKDVNQRVPGTFTYTRFFDLLSDSGKWRDGVEFPQGCVSLHPERDFSYCDRYFDRILDMGVKPLAILGFTPKELVSDESLWGKAFTGSNVSPPNDYVAWQDLVHDVVEHFKQRYGEEEVKDWIWEVWNEPDLYNIFWIEEKYCGGIAYNDNWPVTDRCFSDSDCSGTPCIQATNPDWYPQGHMLEYTRLYDYTAEGLFSVSPDFQIAGAVTAGSYVEPLLMHLSGNSISGNSTADPEGRNWATGQIGGEKINYLSYHGYASHPSEFIDTLDQMESAIATIDYKYGTNYRSYPTIITEYSPYTLSPHSYVTRFPAAWLAGIADAIVERADREGNLNLIPYHMNYLTTPVAKDFGDGGQETDGLATTIGDSSGVVKLPIFNAFEALGHLNGQRLQDVTQGSNIGTIASKGTTTDGKEVINIVVYNLDPADPDCTSSASQQIDIQIDHLPFQSFTLEHYRIDHEHSNAYQLWSNGVKQLSTLQNRDDLEQLSGFPRADTANGSSYSISINLPSNGVSLIRLVSDSSSPIMDGDINQDGYVNSVDLQLCVNVSLNIEQTPEIIQRADLDGNGTVDQSDIQLVVMSILGFDQ
jgi:xylan 1,4-beta-xylosidase